MNEADTCRTYVIPKLKSAGWEDDFITEQLVLTPGRIVPIGDRHTRKDGLRPDYVLFIRQNIPIAVLGTKAEYAHPAKGLQQAMQYAGMLNIKFADSSNGKGIVEHDFIPGLECDLEAFPSPDELWGRLKGTLKFEDQKDETSGWLAPFAMLRGSSTGKGQRAACPCFWAVTVPSITLRGLPLLCAAFAIRER